MFEQLGGFGVKIKCLISWTLCSKELSVDVYA